MGFIRGALITLFTIVLFLSLFLMNFTAIISSSLYYDTLQPALKSSASEILGNFLGGENIFNEEEKVYMQNYCLIDSEYTFTYENYTSVIPCEIIEQGEEAIINYEADKLVNQIYYTEYDCEFWECVKDSSIPFVLFSEKAKEYWTEKFFLLIGLSLFVFLLIFLLSRKRPITFIITGILLILSALPFRKLDWLLRFVPDEFSAVFSVFFTKAHSIFIIILAIGIGFIVFGVLCKILGWKMKFKKDEEIAKKKNKPSK